jgi:hypothetical protein
MEGFGNKVPGWNNSTVCVKNCRSCGMKKRTVWKETEGSPAVDEVPDVCSGILEVDELGPGR